MPSPIMNLADETQTETSCHFLSVCLFDRFLNLVERAGLLICKRDLWLAVGVETRRQSTWNLMTK